MKKNFAFSARIIKRGLPVRFGLVFLKRTSYALLMLAVAAMPMLAQSGDVDTSQLTTLGTTILTVVVALAGMAFVGLIIWGGLTLSTNRPRGLAMIGGGIFGALLAGLAFAFVNTLTGHSVPTVGMIAFSVPGLLS